MKGHTAREERDEGVVMQENGTAHYRQFMNDDMECYAAAAAKLKLQMK